jgi:hypothetical protein
MAAGHPNKRILAVSKRSCISLKGSEKELAFFIAQRDRPGGRVERAAVGLNTVYELETGRRTPIANNIATMRAKGSEIGRAIAFRRSGGRTRSCLSTHNPGEKK